MNFLASADSKLKLNIFYFFRPATGSKKLDWPIKLGLWSSFTATGYYFLAIGVFGGLKVTPSRWVYLRWAVCWDGAYIICPLDNRTGTFFLYTARLFQWLLTRTACAMSYFPARHFCLCGDSASQSVFRFRERFGSENAAGLPALDEVRNRRGAP